MRLYVGNLSFDTAEEDLQQAFGQLGTVESVHLVRDQFSGRSRGFAFVEMPNDDQARAACEKFDQKDFQGRKLTVNEARPQMRRGGPGGGPGGGERQKRREPRW